MAKEKRWPDRVTVSLPAGTLRLLERLVLPRGQTAATWIRTIVLRAVEDSGITDQGAASGRDR